MKSVTKVMRLSTAILTVDLRYSPAVALDEAAERAERLANAVEQALNDHWTNAAVREILLPAYLEFKGDE